jgi:hypothetical protein
MIELAQLKDPLRGVADDPRLGGVEAHVSIVPVDGSGNVDYLRLQDWAASRGTGIIHPFTEQVRGAIVQQVRGKR